MFKLKDFLAEHITRKLTQKTEEETAPETTLERIKQFNIDNFLQNRKHTRIRGLRRKKMSSSLWRRGNIALQENIMTGHTLLPENVGFTQIREIIQQRALESRERHRARLAKKNPSPAGGLRKPDKFALEEFLAHSPGRRKATGKRQLTSKQE